MQNQFSARALLLTLALVWVGCDSEALDSIDNPPLECVPDASFTNCLDIEGPDLIGIPLEVIEASEMAAARLAARRIQDLVDEGLHSRADEPQELPTDLVSLYQKAILHTYQQSPVVRDSLYALFHLSTKPYPLIEMLHMRVFTSQPIYDQLKSTGRTGIPEADSILGANGFQMTDFDEAGNEAWIEFRTSRWKNYRPIDVRLTNIPQIAEATTEGTKRCFLGPCLDTTAEIQDEGIRLTYTLEWEGCPSGCIFDRTWEYYVDENGMVTELGAKGDSFP